MTWWREEPLTDPEAVLIREVFDAHAVAAFRQNASTAAVVNSAMASLDYPKMVISALATMGGAHAPIDSTARLLGSEDAPETARDILRAGGRVPGWGNSFVKGEPDPEWKRVDDALRAVAPALGARIDRVTAALAKEGKALHPNPSAFTAAAGLALGIPRHLIGWLFVQGRLSAWAQIAAGALR